MLSDDIADPLPPSPATATTIVEGTTRDISLLQQDELQALQWERERAFARDILAAPRGSRERAEVVSLAYDAITEILAARRGISDEPLVMGLDSRCGQLVLKLLSRQRARGLQPNFFEIGYGCGALLKQVSQRGFPVAGIEVSAAMRGQALDLLGMDFQWKLLRGDLLHFEFAEPEHRYSLVYWNDVFEHIPPDEILDYLEQINRLLMPDGCLVTVTPNWHMRPSDITGDVCPPRTEAAGLHLKEYTLREVTSLLRRAGFQHVATPLFIVPGRVVMCGTGLAGLKRLFEPCLEWLPFRMAQLLCRGLGLACTMATKRD